LQRTGKIRDFGVSNFEESDMEQILEEPGGERTATNQVLYNLQRRGIEWDLLPWCRQRRIPVMAYSPIEQGRLLASLRPFSERRGLLPAQVALAWVLCQEGGNCHSKGEQYPTCIRKPSGCRYCTLGRGLSGTR